MERIENNYIVIDTTGPTLKCALKYSSLAFFKELNMGYLHLENLVPAINELILNAGILRKQIDRVFCITGPGSFTGLRIGVTTSNALSFGLDIPSTGFSVFDIYSYLVFNKSNDKTIELCVPITDAKKNRFFCSFLTKDSMLPTPQDDMHDLPIEDILNKISITPEKNILFCGRDNDMVKQKIDGLKPDNGFRFYNDYSALDMISFCDYTIRKGIVSESPEPVYLRKSEAECALAESKLR